MPEPAPRNYRPNATVPLFLNTLYRVERGAFRLMRYTADGNMRMARILLQGDYFTLTDLGEGDLLSVGESQLAVLPFTEEHEMAYARSTIEQFRRALDLMQIVMYDHIIEKLGRLIAYLAETPLLAEDGKLHGTHEFFSQALGLCRETVTKEIGRLRRMGLIETGYRYVRVIDAEGLRNVSFTPVR